MFLLALTALSVLALLPLVAGGLAAVRRARATGSQAAIRAADREGMPEHSHTNHPAHLREARVTSDASSPAASAAVSPAIAEGDDLETRNTIASMCVQTSTPGLPPSVSPASSRGPALGVSHDWAGQHFFPLGMRAHRPDRASCTASPRPRVKCGEADRRRVKRTTRPALLS